MLLERFIEEKYLETCIRKFLDYIEKHQDYEVCSWTMHSLLKFHISKHKDCYWTSDREENSTLRVAKPNTNFALRIHILRWLDKIPSRRVSTDDVRAMIDAFKENKMKKESEFSQYQRTQIAEMRPVTEQDVKIYNNIGILPTPLFSEKDVCSPIYNVSISDADKKNGSPRIGDMIARNPKNHEDQWLVAEQYFKDNFCPLTMQEPSETTTDNLEDELPGDDLFRKLRRLVDTRKAIILSLGEVPYKEQEKIKTMEHDVGQLDEEISKTMREILT